MLLWSQHLLLCDLGTLGLPKWIQNWMKSTLHQQAYGASPLTSTTFLPHHQSIPHLLFSGPTCPWVSHFHVLSTTHYCFGLKIFLRHVMASIPPVFVTSPSTHKAASLLWHLYPLFHQGRTQVSVLWWPFMAFSRSWPLTVEQLLLSVVYEACYCLNYILSFFRKRTMCFISVIYIVPCTVRRK